MLLCLHPSGRVDSPSSLHYMNPHALNQYQTAMLEVGAILQVKSQIVMTDGWEH